MSLSKPERRQRIRFRIRKSISGTATIQDCLYLEVTKKFMLNLLKRCYYSCCFFKRKRNRKGTNVDVAIAVGKLVAEKALKVGISSNIR
jgi:large subunit ribosomal protein L18